MRVVRALHGWRVARLGLARTPGVYGFDCARACVGGDELAGKRASVLHNWMGLIDMYTMSRALKDLTQAEFDWEPHPGAWGVRRRDTCTTPNPGGDARSVWVVDQDWGVQTAAFGMLNPEGEMNEPMTTIGWLLNHFGAAPGLTAALDFVGDPTVPTDDVYRRMWGYTIIPTVDEAVARFREGWAALANALRGTTDEMLERGCEGHPWKRGDRAVSAMLNEVSHHGTQICMLRDMYAHL